MMTLLFLLQQAAGDIRDGNTFFMNDTDFYLEPNGPNKQVSVHKRMENI